MGKNKVVDIEEFLIKKAKKQGIFHIIKAACKKPGKYLTPEQQKILEEVSKNYE